MKGQISKSLPLLSFVKERGRMRSTGNVFQIMSNIAIKLKLNQVSVHEVVVQANFISNKAYAGVGGGDGKVRGEGE